MDKGDDVKNQLASEPLQEPYKWETHREEAGWACMEMSSRGLGSSWWLRRDELVEQVGWRRACDGCYPSGEGVLGG